MHSLTLKQVLDRHGIKVSDAEDRMDKLLLALDGMQLEVLVMIIIGLIDTISMQFDDDKKEWFLNNIGLNVARLGKPGGIKNVN